MTPVSAPVRRRSLTGCAKWWGDGVACREKTLVKPHRHADNCYRRLLLPRTRFGGPSMRFRFLVCVALAGFALATGYSLVAHAADPKAKPAKKKGDDLADDKVI